MPTRESWSSPRDVKHCSHCNSWIAGLRCRRAASIVFSPVEMLAGLRNCLAQFKIPRQVFVADALPTTPAGKVQRNVLANWIAEGRLTRVA